MNQIVKMFQESNARLVKIMAGEYSREQMEDAYREFNGQVKLVNAITQAYAVAAKNKRAGIAFEKMNLMDDHTAIDIGILPGNDKIRCEDKDALITREQCLDYSGTRVDECKGCNHFKATRDALLGFREETA